MSDLPRQNIEVKARYPDLDHARAVCKRIGASFQGTLDQVDTYFRSSDGNRLKLRQINDDRAELIRYERPNHAAARSSRYSVDPVTDVDKTVSSLSQTQGVLCIVRKHRDLFLWQNVRIHLDTVEDLGSFIEFEGVVSAEADAQQSRQRVDQLVIDFEIRPSDQIAVSYSDLLMAR